MIQMCRVMCVAWYCEQEREDKESQHVTLWHSPLFLKNCVCKKNNRVPVDKSRCQGARIAVELQRGLEGDQGPRCRRWWGEGQESDCLQIGGTKSGELVRDYSGSTGKDMLSMLNDEIGNSVAADLALRRREAATERAWWTIRTSAGRAAPMWPVRVRVRDAPW